MKLFKHVLLPTSSMALKKVNVLFDEQIIKISNSEIEIEEPHEEIDLAGRILLPGAIDPHCHIVSDNEPQAQITHISRLALLGGWTCMAELSYRNPQPIFDIREMNHLKSQIDTSSYVAMPFWGNVEIENYPYHAESALELWTRGALGLAIFSPSPNDAITELSFDEIMDLFMDIYESDTAFTFQGWDQENHSKPSDDAQRDAIRKILRRMQENPIHIPRVNAWETIDFVNSISKRSDISFSINILNLMQFYETEVNSNVDFDFGTAEERQELLHLVRTNKLYTVSHNAGICDEKQEPLFACEAPDLMPYSYLWMLSELWKKRRVPLATVIKMVSENPAKRLGIYPEKGCIAVGSDADFVILDPTVNTIMPLNDHQEMELEGHIDSVWIKGEMAVENGEILERRGGYLPRMHTPRRRHNKRSWIS